MENYVNKILKNASENDDLTEVLDILAIMLCFLKEEIKERKLNDSQ